MRPVPIVRTHLRTARNLTGLVLLAVALAWIVSAKAVANSTFQSPPFESPVETETTTATNAPTVTATPSPSGGPIRGPGETATPPPTPIFQATETPIETSTPFPTPLPLATETPAETPTPPGYLPPPTLTSPGTPVPAQLSVPSLGVPPQRGRTPTPPRDAESQPGSSRIFLGLARLIDQAVIALGYLWLCCGVFVLLAVGGILVWLVRRGQRT